MAATQGLPVFYPPFWTSGTGASSFALNAAASGGYSANWYAVAIVPLIGGTLSKVYQYASAVTGTLGSSDLVCDLYSDSAGAPNASIESRATVASVPTGAATIEWTGFTATLTAGTRYWLVFRNANATPTSNSYTLWHALTLVPFGGNTAPTAGMVVASSTNSGSSWSSTLTFGSTVIEYSGGAREGFPGILGSSVQGQIYSSREVGIFCVSPAVQLKAIGIAAPVTYTGTPTGSVQYRLYTGSSASPTLVATTGTLPLAGVNNQAQLKPLYFSTPQTIAANTTLRIVVSETTQSDTSGNRYNLGGLSVMNGFAGILSPVAGEIKGTLSADGGDTFSETADQLPQIYLILDNDTPYPAATILAANPIRGFIS